MATDNTLLADSLDVVGIAVARQASRRLLSSVTSP